jgi:hypothetical protein
LMDIIGINSFFTVRGPKIINKGFCKSHFITKKNLCINQLLSINHDVNDNVSIKHSVSCLVIFQFHYFRI